MSPSIALIAAVTKKPDPETRSAYLLHTKVSKLSANYPLWENAYLVISYLNFNTKRYQIFERYSGKYEQTYELRSDSREIPQKLVLYLNIMKDVLLRGD